MKDIKIVFANPAYRIELEDGFEQYFFCAGSRCPWSLIKKKSEYPRYAMFPFMMGYAAALLEANGFRVEAIDAVPLNLTEDDFLDQVMGANPGIIFFEPATTSLNYVAHIAEVLKERTGAIIIFSGSHVTALPEESLKSYPVADILIRGEYEFALLELVRALAHGFPYNDIDGLAFRKGDGQLIIHDKVAVQDIDRLPLPARHLFPSASNPDLGLYHDGFCQNRPALQMHSSRGCPFHCKFCLWTQVIYTQGKYRMFKPERVVEEMIQLRDRYGAREIYIDDDTFTGNKQHVLHICRLITERKLHIPWAAMGDAMVTDEEMILAMKKAGCIGIKFGLESADPDILSDIRKPLDTKRLARLVRQCNRLRIKTHVSVSFGHMKETRESVEHTLKFINKLSSDSIQFSIATPYPGTIFYEEASREGYLADLEWVQYDPTHRSIVNLPGISAEELKRLEATSHGQWLRRKLMKPGWVLRQVYFLYYLMRRQGMKGFINRLRRAALLLFSKNFR